MALREDKLRAFWEDILSWRREVVSREADVVATEEESRKDSDRLAMLDIELGLERDLLDKWEESVADAETY